MMAFLIYSIFKTIELVTMHANLRMDTKTGKRIYTCKFTAYNEIDINDSDMTLKRSS